MPISYIYGSNFPTQFAFQTPGETKKEGVIKDGEKVELCTYAPLYRGLVAETKTSAGEKFLISRPWQADKKEGFLQFTFHYVK